MSGLEKKTFLFRWDNVLLILTSQYLLIILEMLLA